MKFAISTKKLPATNTKGARVKATLHMPDGTQESATKGWDDALTGRANEYAIMLELCEQHNLTPLASDRMDYMDMRNERIWVAKRG